MMDDAQASANNETKSSAGDKYETGRAMMQMERDKYAMQLSQATQTRNKLKLVNPERNAERISVGSIIRTRLANYFIAISAGRMEVEGQKFYVISPDAPLAKLFLQKQAGDVVIFNDQEMKILEVF